MNIDIRKFFCLLSAHYLQWILQVVFVVYMIMVTLLLVNMLIAMMGNTYSIVNETQKEYFRQVSSC